MELWLAMLTLTHAFTSVADSLLRTAAGPLVQPHLVGSTPPPCPLCLCRWRLSCRLNVGCRLRQRRSTSLAGDFAAGKLACGATPTMAAPGCGPRSVASRSCRCTHSEAPSWLSMRPRSATVNAAAQYSGVAGQAEHPRAPAAWCSGLAAPSQTMCGGDWSGTSRPAARVAQLLPWLTTDSLPRYCTNYSTLSTVI
jgi:hypothetical protein